MDPLLYENAALDWIQSILKVEAPNRRFQSFTIDSLLPTIFIISESEILPINQGCSSHDLSVQTAPSYIGLSESENPKVQNRAIPT